MSQLLLVITQLLLQLRKELWKKPTVNQMQELRQLLLRKLKLLLRKRAAGKAFVGLVPLQAGGTFRLWVRGGALVKYETRLEGVLRVDDAAGRREVRVNETSTTTLSEVGTARVEVPPEVRKRLGG